jgi:uncharacterized protein YndB with AHSA1/START domain
VAIRTCPTCVVAARPERIWSLLTVPAELAHWTGTRIVEAPERTLAPGDRVVLRPAPTLRVVFDILSAEPLKELRFDARLPFGVTNHEVVTLSPLAGGCRVTFN